LTLEPESAKIAVVRLFEKPPLTFRHRRSRTMFARILGLAIFGMAICAVDLEADDGAKGTATPAITKEQIPTPPTKILKEQIPTLPAKIVREQIPTLPARVTPKEQISTPPAKRLEGPADGAGEAKRPNIVLILADDLGYGDLGCYGQQKIRTPHLDKMANEGMRFTQFYSGSPVCAPSRCVLMTGLHSGHAYIRNNKEMKPEGQLPIPVETVTLATLLRQAGYHTGIFGKWGLGMFGTSGDPLRHGFDSFYGYNCQAHAHNFYPTYLYRQDKRIELPGNPGIATGKHYSHDLIEKEALDFIRENKDRPFFLYLPATLPHLALQVPEADLAEYKGKFEEKPYDGKKGYQPHPTPRAAYAAMVSRLDRTVGRVMALLKELNLDENTIVIFSSDNGAVYAGVGGSDPLFFRSTGLLRDFKGSVHEGGVRIPFIVRWPGKVPPGKTNNFIGAFQDFLPTFCEIAGVKTSAKLDGLSILPTLTGKGKQTEHPYLYFEFQGYGGQQAVRMGPWKAVRKNLLKGNMEIELYNLDRDLSETTDIASQHSDILANLRRILEENHTPSPQFPIPILDRTAER